MRLVVERDGRVRCLYGEAVDLASLGELAVRRACHVEPDGRGRWWADLGPVAGPRLGPFALRSRALQAECDWLEAHWLGWTDAGARPSPAPRVEVPPCPARSLSTSSTCPSTPRTASPDGRTPRCGAR